MIWRVLVIGGYGNFGSFISRALAKESNLQVIVAGRSIEKAQEFVSSIQTANTIEAASVDITQDFTIALQTINPHIVIHTSGPFQTQGYDVAQACISTGTHYLDLADGREFVECITKLDGLAKDNKVLIVSGASSVPCLTSALVDHYLPQFKELEHLDYGITTAQKTARGLATTAAILGYTGKPFETIIDGKRENVYGWQGLRARKYRGIGWRLLGNCNVPDLALFPDRYPTVKTIRFYAGLEIGFIHMTLWALSWLVRVGLFRRLENRASLLLRLSFLFDWLGSTKSAFHMDLFGKDGEGKNKLIEFELIAKSGDGPYIPCMPAILMTKKIAANEIKTFGAFPCIGFITRDEYLAALGDLDITWEEHCK